MDFRKKVYRNIEGQGSQEHLDWVRSLHCARFITLFIILCIILCGIQVHIAEENFGSGWVRNSPHWGPERTDGFAEIPLVQGFFFIFANSY